MNCPLEGHGTPTGISCAVSIYAAQAALKRHPVAEGNVITVRISSKPP
jgi:hypothetical protein